MAGEYPAGSPWWHGPIDDGWSLAALLDGASRLHAARPALWSEASGTLTHGDLRSRAARVRAALLSAASAGSRTVACLASMDAPLYIGLHAVMTSGLAYAALEPDAPAARNRMCLEDCGADLILADAGSMARAEELAGGSRRVLTIEDAMALGTEAPAAKVHPDAAAAYVFTSGSTGRPKAVVRSQRSLARAMYCFAENLGYGPDDVMLYPGSPGHIGSLNDALTCMTTGFKSIPIDIARVDLVGVCETLVKHRVTRMPMPPSLLRLLLRLMAGVRDDLRLKTVVASGEALLRSDVGLFYEVMGGRAVLWQNYGSTETGPIAAGKYSAEDAEGVGPLPLRRVHLGGSLEVVDSGGAPAPDGEIGEFRVRSNFLADGYLNAPPDQAARFGRDARGRFFAIGDRGHRTPTGEYFIAGRADRQVKVHGRRLELGDIESAIMSHREWAEAVVVQTGLHGTANGKENGRTRSPSLVAVIRPAPGVRADLPVLRDQLLKKLPAAAIPRRFMVVDQMPRTTTGKIDLAGVARLAAQARELSSLGRGGPPRGTTENWIADTWQSVLHIERPGREDRFQDLGGDSLAAIDLCLALEKQFAITVGLDQVAECQTISRLAEVVRQNLTAPREPFARLRADGAGPVCVLYPGIGGHAWIFSDLARALASDCDVVAISLCDLAAEQGDIRARVREQTLRIAASVRGRPLVLGGYSFGGMLAADSAAWLVAQGVPVDRVLLIDPSPWDSEPPRTTIRTVAQVVRDHVTGRTRKRRVSRGARSAAARAIEESVEKTTRMLVEHYLDGSVTLPAVDVRWLASREKIEKHAALARVFGLEKELIPREETATLHLELIRVPAAEETARWVDAQLASERPAVAR